MTRDLRRRHLLMWLVLGPVAGVVLILAIVWKPQVPAIEATPSAANRTGPGASP